MQQFGIQGLTELTTLMGYYALLAFNANAFAIDLPADRTETAPPVGAMVVKVPQIPPPRSNTILVWVVLFSGAHGLLSERP